MLAVWIRRRETAASARVLTPASAAHPGDSDDVLTDSATIEVALLGDDPFVVHVERVQLSDEDRQHEHAPRNGHKPAGGLPSDPR
jgi:hypothetical protein